MHNNRNERLPKAGATSNEGLERDFEAWWESNGQFFRAGGGQYEKIFAYHAWIDSAKAEREACAMMLDAEADKQEREWNEYLASGKQGPATSLHGIPRGYAAEIRKRSNANITGG